MHVLVEQCLGGDHWGILKEKVKTYLMAPTSPLNSPTFFLPWLLHIYSLWSHIRCLMSLRDRGLCACRTRWVSHPAFTGIMTEVVVTEVPSALKQLARLVSRGFYSIEDSLIVDILVRNPCEWLLVLFCAILFLQPPWRPFPKESCQITSLSLSGTYLWPSLFALFFFLVPMNLWLRSRGFSSESLQLSKLVMSRDVWPVLNTVTILPSFCP